MPKELQEKGNKNNVQLIKHQNYAQQDFSNFDNADRKRQLSE